jgi:hypothetical protein
MSSSDRKTIVREAESTESTRSGGSICDNEVHKKGHLTFEFPVIDDIVQVDGKWHFDGYTPAEFGFHHRWSVGPFETIKDGLKEFFNHVEAKWKDK